MQLAPVRHRRVTVEGIDTYYREAGPADAPVLLCRTDTPHRRSFTAISWLRSATDGGLVAPDLPGFGYSATPSPEDFGYTFDAYAGFLQAFVETIGLSALRHVAA